MKTKFYTLLLASALAFFMSACARNPSPSSSGEQSSGGDSSEGDHEHVGGDLGFCSVCGDYLGQEANLKANIGPTIQKGGYAYYRVELNSGDDTHYGLFTDFNEVEGNEAKVEYFVLIDKAPHKIGEAKTNETKLIPIPLGTDDNYLYLVYSYTGDAETLTLENSYVTNLNSQACDDNR